MDYQLMPMLLAGLGLDPASMELFVRRISLINTSMQRIAKERAVKNG